VVSFYLDGFPFLPQKLFFAISEVFPVYQGNFSYQSRKFPLLPAEFPLQHTESVICLVSPTTYCMRFSPYSSKIFHFNLEYFLFYLKSSRHVQDESRPDSTRSLRLHIQLQSNTECWTHFSNPPASTPSRLAGAGIATSKYNNSM
jgi:hypothetical protein